MGYTSIPLASCPELAKMGRVGIQWGHGKIRFHTWSINSCSTVWFSTLASGTGSSLVFLRLFTAGSCLPSISCALLQPHHPSLQTFLSSSIRWFEGASILSSMRIEAPSNHHILPTVTQEVPCPHCCEQIWETKMVTKICKIRCYALQTQTTGSEAMQSFHANTTHLHIICFSLLAFSLGLLSFCC